MRAYATLARIRRHYAARLNSSVRHVLRPSSSAPIFVLTCIAVMQLFAGAAALLWAWPLFADPPFLSNGATQEISRLRSINAENSHALDLLTTQREKISWLFEHHSEGVLIALVAGSCLVFCGATLLFVALWLRRIDRRSSARA